MDDIEPANIPIPVSIVSRVLALIDESRINPTDEPVIKVVARMRRGAVTYARISLERSVDGNRRGMGEDSKRWLTPQQAAARTGYTKERIRQMLRQKRLVGEIRDRRWLVDPASLWPKDRNGI